MAVEDEVTRLRAEIEHYKTVLQGLHDSGERYRALVDSSDDAIISKDLNGIVTSWNAGAERIFGYSAQEMIGQPIMKLIPPEYRDEEVGILEMLRNGQRVDHFETVRVRKDGTRFNISVTISPIKNAEGKVVGASKVGRDITLRIREGELRNRMSAIVESSDDAIISKDLKGIITSWNRGAQRIFGYTADEAIGRSILMLVPKDLESEEGTILGRLRKGERIEHYHTKRVRKDGGVIDLALTISPLRNDKGEIIGASKVARDITEQHRANALLKESEEKFTTVFHEAPIGSILAELPTGRLMDANPAFLRITGHTLEEVQGRSVFDLGFRITTEELDRIIGQLVEDGHLRGVELDFRHRHGDHMVVVVNATVLTIAHQPLMLMHVEDITLRKNAEAALRETDRRKDEFLATLAHELRNPLAPMSNALQLLELAPEDAAIRAQSRAMMNRQLHQMVHLVDDLLDLSRVNRGVIELQPKAMDLRSALVQAIEANRPMADQRGHTVTLDLAPQPLWVDGDNTRLVQVFSNILNNAAKYTDDGGLITITSAVHDGSAVVEVADNGTGIDPAKAGQVFDMFAQLENSTTRKQGGLGIGLSIVKQLVILHGGEIDVTSPGPGRGSTFTVRLPLGQPPVQEPPLLARESETFPPPCACW